MSRRCVFLDRDGVINAKKRDGEYVTSCSEFEFLPNITDWIRLFNSLNCLVVVVTNQRGVALGKMTEEDLTVIHEYMVRELAKSGAYIDDILACVHSGDTCDCRKPKPGLVYQARDKWGINLEESIMIGDSDADASLAATCGMGFLRAFGGKLK